MLDAQDWSTLPAHSAFAVRRMSEMGARSEAADAEDAEGYTAAATEPSGPDVAVAEVLALLQEEAENEWQRQQGGEAAHALVAPSAAPALVPVAATGIADVDDEQQWADDELIRAAEAWLAEQQQQ